MMNTASDKKDTKILIIDDEPGIRNLLSYELGMQGYTVVTAPNGYDGVELVKKEPFQLILTDIKMPKMDGLEVLDNVKKIDPDIEVIMITGYGTINTAVAAIKKGAYDFVQKPFNLDEILSLIEKALEKAELKAQLALYEASKVIFSALKMDDLIPALIDLGGKIIRADDLSLILRDPKTGSLSIAASRGVEDPTALEMRLALVTRLTADTNSATTEDGLMTGHLDKDERASGLSGAESIKALLLSPLHSKNRILGYFCAVRTELDSAFTQTDRRNANIFTSLTAQAVDNAQLYRELETKIAALNQAYAKLAQMQKTLVQSEKLAAIGQLSAGVAHELNNPLTIVIGLSELLLEDPNQSESQKKDLQQVKEQAERCRRIILNLLQFAQKNESEKASTQINSILDKTIELFKFNLQKTEVELVKEFDDKLPEIEINPYQMQQVFLNIMNNALYAIKDRPQPRLSFKTRMNGNNIAISFTDNGSGIAENMVSRIFDPFFTTKEVGKGTGLGLSISYGIVKEHGGDIHVQSAEGKGATFTIELPATPGA